MWRQNIYRLLRRNQHRGAAPKCSQQCTAVSATSGSYRMQNGLTTSDPAHLPDAAPSPRPSRPHHVHQTSRAVLGTTSRHQAESLPPPVIQSLASGQLHAHSRLVSLDAARVRRAGCGASAHAECRTLRPMLTAAALEGHQTHTLRAFGVIAADRWSQEADVQYCEVVGRQHKFKRGSHTQRMRPRSPVFRAARGTYRRSDQHIGALS